LPGYFALLGWGLAVATVRGLAVATVRGLAAARAPALKG